jgi:acyl-CoA synthetase (NDP forming)
VDRALTLERLRAVLAPRSIALVGASDRSGWSTGAFGNFATLGFEGALHLVNRNGGEVHGRPVVTSCREIGEPVDLALMLVGNAALPGALADAAAAGIRFAVVLAAGFGEVGGDGERAQRELVELCARLGITVVGPNCLGFISVLDRVPAWSGMLPVPLIPGAVAIVSQSGAAASTIASCAAARAIGVSHVISTGNEAMVDSIAMAAAVLEDGRVRSIAMFAESIPDAERFRRLAARAANLRKPIVMMKVGTSQLGAEIARTHTGAIVGDDRLIDAALRQCGIVRVYSLEELAITAGLLAKTGPLPPGGLGAVSISGAGCDIIADRAETAGLALPALAEATASRLAALLPDYGTLRNPLDITGAASEAPEMFADALEAIASDPGVAVLLAVHVLPTEGRAAGFRPRLEVIARGLRAAGNRGLLVDFTAGGIDPFTAGVLDEIGVPHAIAGLRDAVDAIANAVRWSAWLRRPQLTRPPESELDVPDRAGSWSEVRALDVLAAQGVPVVPWRLVRTRAEAIVAAREIGHPVVVKVVAAEILHKSDIGGVALDLVTDDAVGDAFERVTAAGAAVAAAPKEGARGGAMRHGGVELIAGVVRDPHWGATLAVGIGGVLVHAFDDVALRLLPAGEDDVREMLGELRGKALLDGARGSMPVDIDRLVEAIVAFARVAQRLGPELASVEINPLRADGANVEALDAAVVWQSAVPLQEARR